MNSTVPAPVVIALDAMGGDHAPQSVVEGAALALKKNAGLRFLFFGDPARLEPLLAHLPLLNKVSTIRPAPDVIAATMKPSMALRQGGKSSMRLALNAVAQGEAACVVSAGNTGALMVLAKFALKMLPGIDRPAIAAVLPTTKGRVLVLDLGANLDSSANNLVQFALMGALYCQAVLGVSVPSVGILNIGVEEMKGHDDIRAAAQILREHTGFPGRFHGFVEGDDIASGTVDVVVTDGFSGNVALKTMEGTARLITHFLKQAFRASLLAKLGYLFVRPALQKLRHRADPRRYNGAMFLGLRGVCVKSHGGTDALGFSNAILEACSIVQNNLNQRISHAIIAYQAHNEDISAQEVVCDDTNTRVHAVAQSG